MVRLEGHKVHARHIGASGAHALVHDALVVWRGHLMEEKPPVRVCGQHRGEHRVKLRVALKRLGHAQVPVAIGGHDGAEALAREVAKELAVDPRDERAVHMLFKVVLIVLVHRGRGQQLEALRVVLARRGHLGGRPRDVVVH